MARTSEAKQNLRELCRIAARVFYAKSFDGASMQDIAEAVGLTKAGLYHHVGSKDRLLYEIQNYGMDILDEIVLVPIKDIADPREKLRQTIVGHIDLIVSARDQEITVILHENRSLSGPLRKKLNARKRGYIDYLIDLIGRVQEQSGRPPQIRPAAGRLCPAGNDQLALPVVQHRRSHQAGRTRPGLHGLLLSRTPGNNLAGISHHAGRARKGGASSPAEIAAPASFHFAPRAARGRKLRGAPYTKLIKKSLQRRG